MAMSDDDRRALETRLATSGSGAVDVVAAAVAEGEELREILVDAQGDVVAFTDRRALYIADGSDDAVAVGYDEVEVRQRAAGLAIDALIEGGRLVLDVARGTFARLAVVGAGGAPGRASWLPVRTPPPVVSPVQSVTPPPQPPWGGAAPAPMSGPSGPTPPAAPVPPTPVAPPTPAAAPWQPAPVPPSAPWQAEPQPAQPPQPAPQPAFQGAPPQPTSAMPPPGLPPAGWHPDPSRRHWWRWWDGQDWTEHVADGGPPSIDPLPPR